MKHQVDLGLSKEGKTGVEEFQISNFKFKGQSFLYWKDVSATIFSVNNLFLAFKSKMFWCDLKSKLFNNVYCVLLYCLNQNCSDVFNF